MKMRDIVFWYLRVNGFLLLEDVNIHGDNRGEVRTDIDFLGVRLRYRQEYIIGKFEDDSWIPSDRSVVLFVEAKTGQDTFNSSWEKRDVVESFVRFVGASLSEEWSQIVEDLTEDGRSEAGDWVYQFAFVSDGRFPLNREVLAGAIEFKLEDMLRFIFWRYKKYTRFKHNHPTWPTVGNELWDIYRRSPIEKDFIGSVLETAI